jgi:uncharacterized protein (DUF305 family)
MGKVAGAVAATLQTLVAALVFGACGGEQGDPTDEPGRTGRFNDTDVAFAQEMIVHHGQALTMSKLADARAQDPRVRTLAAAIAAEQEPEIHAFTRLLRTWGQPAPTGSADTPHMTPHRPTPHPTRHMPTLPPMPDLSRMRDMHGTQFDRMFLQEMIAHHEAAVTMARAELRGGVNPEARQLAGHIEASQTGQISQMRQLLAIPAPTPS